MESRDDDPHLSISLELLSNTNRAGRVYVRAPETDRQIVEVLALSREAMRSRATVAQRESTDYLSEECLVYLLRHYFRQEDTARVNDLALALVRRSTRIIRKHLRPLGREALEDGHSEIVTRLFRRLLDISTNKADFLQVRFWVALKRLCIQEFNRQLRRLTRDRQALSFSQGPGYDGEEEDHVESTAVRFTENDKRQASTPSDEQAVIEDDLRRAALSQLEEPFRSAFMLRHCEGWPIEDQDPTVPTISRHFGKTPRTIRNWLATANEILARWQGGHK